MDFKNKSVIDICNSIYDSFDIPFGYNHYSSIDLYNYIMQQTNGFEKDLLDYLIRDIRNFYRFIEFEIKNPYERPEIVIDDITGNPTEDSYEARENYKEYLTCDINNLPVYYKNLYGNLLVFNDRQTLREKVDIIDKSIPEICYFCHHITELLNFSDIAEKEYEKAIKRQKDKMDIHKKDILEDLSSKEFIQYCFKNDLPSLEIYNYIQEKTDDFDSKKVKLFINELYKFNETVPIYVTEDKEYNGIISSQEVKYLLIGYLNSFRLKNYENPELKDLLDEIDAALIRPDLNLALKVARKINPKIRISLEYNSFINILNILEINMKEDFNQNIKTIDNFNFNFPLPQATDQINSHTNSSLSLAEIDLICYYLGNQITKDNADDYLKKFCIEATAKSIIENYNYYQKKKNRIYSKGKKANDFHLKRLENVVKYLKENDLSFEEAENDLKLFQENME